MARCVLIPTDEAVELPLFHYARELLKENGHEVVMTAADGALHDVDFVIAFGDGCRRAADVDLGVWISPDFNAERTATALTNAKGPGLVVGSLDDPAWDRAAAARLRQFELLHLSGVDRLLESPGDVINSIAVMQKVLGRIAATVRRLV